MARKYKYIYGPVPSWRLGRSLGVDPISGSEKICPFNCVYCQIGDSIEYDVVRSVFVPSKNILSEIASLPKDVEIDYITFSGRGEPTLAKNLGELIRGIKKIRSEPVAVITNSSIIARADVEADLALADLVMAKLDAHTEELFHEINRPAPGITLKKTLAGLKSFREKYSGKFALQIMFIEKNRSFARGLAELAKSLSPDEVQLNTPLRPSAEKPLTKDEMTSIAASFKGMNIVTVYEGHHKPVKPVSTKEALHRRGRGGENF